MEEKIVLGNTLRGENVNPNSAGDIPQRDIKEMANEHGIPAQYLDTEFKVPTETVRLPSNGVFYPGNKSTVTLKYLTAEEDDILYSPELIKSGKVLDVLLDKSIMDEDLRPDSMLSGDRNFLLIEMRKTGLGSEYVPGEIVCPSCNESSNPRIDLDLLKSKVLDIMPDEQGEYPVILPIMKANIKFRLLTGSDEKRIAKLTEVKGGKSGMKVSKLITEKYLMQIMEVNGNRDKIHIKKFIGIMPMKDSAFFREYARRIEPGLDLSYEFECPNCSHTYTRDIPITPKLFYPDLEE